VSLVPLYGFLEGDTLGLLMLARTEMTMTELANSLVAAAQVRVAFEGEARVYVASRAMEGSATVAQVGLDALDRFDVRRERAE